MDQNEKTKRDTVKALKEIRNLVSENKKLVALLGGAIVLGLVLLAFNNSRKRD